MLIIPCKYFINDALSWKMFQVKFIWLKEKKIEKLI